MPDGGAGAFEVAQLQLDDRWWDRAEHGGGHEHGLLRLTEGIEDRAVGPFDLPQLLSILAKAGSGDGRFLGFR